MNRLAVGVLLTAPIPALAQSTTRASVDSQAAQSNGSSTEASISSGGRYTCFTSLASNLVTGDSNNTFDVFRHDALTGQTVCVSLNMGGVPASGASTTPAITPSGRFVSFTSQAADLVAGDTNALADVFVRDLSTGAVELVSKSTAGVQCDVAAGSSSISNDGRYVAFNSYATNLVPNDTNGTSDVFVRDRTLGTTVRVSVSTAGTQANGVCALTTGDFALSGNGRWVSFTSAATNLVTLDGNGSTQDVFLRDLQTGTTSLASLTFAGGPGNSSSGHNAISSDGLFVAFESNASNLVPGDTNGKRDIFVRDLLIGTTTRASLSSTGAEGNADSFHPAISADGRFVSFDTQSTTLVANDNAQFDVFVRDRGTGLTTVESWTSAGLPSSGTSERPTLSPDGRWVAFESQSTDLVPNDTNATYDVFLRDRGPLPAYGTYCLGDGTGTACPCGNESLYGLKEGCRSSLGYGGKLTAQGNPNVTNDSFVLIGTQMPNAAALYFQGTVRLNNGAGAVFGDGLRCAGGTVVRLGDVTNTLGGSQYPGTGDLAISVKGAVPAGSSRYYQCWYRNAAAFCTTSTFNLTNALDVFWFPCTICP
jgi:Tol biopolymer transport system component